MAERERELLKQARQKARRKAAANAALTVDQLLDAYLARPNIRDNTRAADTYHAVHIRRLLGQRQAATLTAADVEAFMTAQRERGLMQTTINRRAKVLRAACNWAVEKRMLAVSPLVGLRLPHARSRRITPPTMTELRRVLAVAPEHIRRVIWLEMGTGARPGPSETLRLQWGLVAHEAGRMLMPCAAKRHDGHDYRYLPQAD